MLGGVVLLALLHSPIQAVQNVTVAWDKSPDQSAIGYNIYYGPASRNYTNTINVGNVTNRTISGLMEGATYYFAATAYDTAGVESVFSNEAGYTVPLSNNLPTVTLTSPANGASYTAPATIDFSASVTANGQTITKVQFYHGAALLGEDTAAPYTFTWSGVSAGSYALTAQAVYGSGSTIASTPASITVSNLLPPAIALTTPSSGASYTAPATVNLAASVTANGQTITKVQFYNGATLLGEDIAAPYSYSWSNVNAGSYGLTARAVYGAGSMVASASVDIAVTGLPASWQTADIGSVGVVGSADWSSGVFTVKGAGNISGRADNFRFVYQALTGDGEIKACLNSMVNTGTSSGRIGVIIRESLTSGSRYAFMGLTPDGTFRWQRRSNTGGSTGATTSTVGTPPNAWVRLVRTGSTLYGYGSTDGITWTLVNSRNITMATTIYFGLAVASGSSTNLNTAIFNNLSVIP